MLDGKEKLEYQIQKGNEKLVCDALGFINYEHYKQFKANASAGLAILGNLFYTALGEALKQASDKDAMKIIATWRNEVTQAEMLYRLHYAKEQAAK